MHEIYYMRDGNLQMLYEHAFISPWDIPLYMHVLAVDGSSCPCGHSNVDNLVHEYLETVSQNIVLVSHWVFRGI